MKEVTCKSGLKGWRAKLQENYLNYREFKDYSIIFGLHTRLGYESPKDAWDANPLVEGSVEPSDFQKVVDISH